MKKTINFWKPEELKILEKGVKSTNSFAEAARKVQLLLPGRNFLSIQAQAYIKFGVRKRKPKGAILPIGSKITLEKARVTMTPDGIFHVEAIK